MTPEQMTALRAPFPAEEIGKLPRSTCRDCSQGRDSCSKHSKSKCSVCNAWITSAHIHLDFVGHAELTDRLLDVDPSWGWEPMAFTPEGAPYVQKHGNNLVMWGRLTIHGVTRPGVGTALANKDDAHKELIGDFLRNAAMRFGVALDLWRKTEKADLEHPLEAHDSPGEGNAPLEGRDSNAEGTPSVADSGLTPGASGPNPSLGDPQHMTKAELVQALADADLPTNGREEVLRERWAEHVAGKAVTSLAAAGLVAEDAPDDPTRPFDPAAPDVANELVAKANRIRAEKARAAS